MYPSERRFDIRSIGVWKLPVGRPTEQTKQTWVQKCNFVLRCSARVELLDAGADELRQCGWIVDVRTQDGRQTAVFVSIAVASSTVKLRKRLMTCVPGAVCRLGCEDFLAFMDHDDAVAATVYMPSHVGKVRVDGRDVWVFPDVVLDEAGERVLDAPIFFDREHVRHRENGEVVCLPSLLPAPTERCADAPRRLRALSTSLRTVYGAKTPYVLHLLTSVLKAIHFDALMRDEHFVPVANISGPANVGKTLACAVALMLSRCTASAMIDATHTLKNMLVVWDDPRDATAAQLSAIVHEAFSGQATNVVSRGVRRYHSVLIIGTQERLLGMPYTGVNAATFTRLSHMDMSGAAGINGKGEPALQQAMRALDGVFGHLLASTEYRAAEVARLHDALTKRAGDEVVHRSLRVAAIDWFFARALVDLGFDCPEADAYFAGTYLDFLRRHCARLSPLEQFCRQIRELLARRVPMPKDSFKDRVLADLKACDPTECVALYPKDFFPYLEAMHVKAPLTKEQLHGAIKSNPQLGEVGRNVAYRTHAGVQIRRSVVLRHVCIFGA